jgi:hypothetical protein
MGYDSYVIFLPMKYFSIDTNFQIVHVRCEAGCLNDREDGRSLKWDVIFTLVSGGLMRGSHGAKVNGA